MADHLITPRKCVYFVGPASTGKTTLAKALQRKCTADTFFLTEVARSVLRQIKCNADDISADPIKCYELQKAILITQSKLENELFADNQKFISDRSTIDPIVYAKFFIKDDVYESLLDLEEWHTTLSRYKDKTKTLLVLIEPNEQFLRDDGTRKMPINLDDWLSFYKCFISFMKLHGIPFETIPSYQTDIHQRVDQVIEWLN